MSKPGTLGARQKIKKAKKAVSSGLILIVVVAVALALGYLRIKAEAIRLGYEISWNKKETKELLKENQILKSEFMKAISADSLESTAMELGFKFPTQEDIVYIEQKHILSDKME